MNFYQYLNGRLGRWGKEIFLPNDTAVVGAIIAFSIHLYLFLTVVPERRSEIVAGFGAATAALGIFLAVRPIFRMGICEAIQLETIKRVPNPFAFTSGSHEDHQLIDDARKAKRSEVIGDWLGLVLIFLGTLINGYSAQLARAIAHAMSLTQDGLGRPSEGQGGSFLMSFFDIKITDVLLVVFTGLLARFTWLLYKSTQNLWTATKDAAIRQASDTETLQRAYLSINPGGIRQFRSRDGRLACNVFIVNAGNLPASQVKWFIRWKFSRDGRDQLFPITGPGDGNNIIVPKSRMIKGGPPILGKDLDDFGQAGTRDDRWLYVWGRVTYRDGFAKERATDFCHRYNLIGLSPEEWDIPISDARFHEHGNRTDEQ